MKKIYISDLASLLESKIIPEVKKVFNLPQADIVVNPESGILINKVIIVNLPNNIPLDQLLQSNTVISRFPIGYDIPVIPYTIDEDTQVEVNKEDYSCLILRPEVLNNLDYGDFIKNTKFLVGVSESIDENLTLVGKLVASTKISERGFTEVEPLNNDNNK